MVKAKRKRKRDKRDWHHRVPDFKLVYCGPKRLKSRKEGELVKKRSLISVRTDGNENTEND